MNDTNTKGSRTTAIKVRGGRGTDASGIVRDYGEFVKDGIVEVSPASEDYLFEVWRIYDAKGRLVRVKDWGRNEGLPVWPEAVRVWLGKKAHVDVGYQRRKDGTFYAYVRECFPKSATRLFEMYRASRLGRLVEVVKQCPEWNSLCYGIHLPDETKRAYKAAIDEAASGRLGKPEFLRDEI